MQLEIGKTYTLKHNTKARCTVLAKITGHTSPERYWVEVSNCVGWLTHAGQFLSCGKRVECFETWQLIEIPSEPIKREGWIGLIEYRSKAVGLEGIWQSKDLLLNNASLSGYKVLACKKIIITEGEFDE